MSKFNFVSPNALKKGSHALLKDGLLACRISAAKWSKPGKHGSAKITVTAVDLFTGKKVTDTLLSHKDVKKPVVVREQMVLFSIDFDAETCTVLDNDNVLHEDVAIPPTSMKQRAELEATFDEDDEDAEWEATILSAPTCPRGDHSGELQLYRQLQAVKRVKSE